MFVVNVFNNLIEMTNEMEKLKGKLHTKEYSTRSELLEAITAMVIYQKIHNIIRDDYKELLNMTEKYKSEEVKFNSLYRACIRSLFSIIEADIFGLNNIDEYENYSDKDSFENKFKKTFKQICRSWRKIDLQKKYFAEKYHDLSELKKKRDELIHPKKVEHLHKASKTEFEKLKRVFNDYDLFINSLMDNFFIKQKKN